MLICGDAKQLPLKDGSVQVIVTSPPYWCTRKYEGVKPSIWGGDPDCQHEWEGAGTTRKSNRNKDFNKRWGRVIGLRKQEEGRPKRIQHGEFCTRCGAWKGMLGLEPQPELYVKHILEVAREWWRVLRNDGVLWINLGDTFASRPNGPNSLQTSTLQGTYAGHEYKIARALRRSDKPKGRKHKDLIGIPWMVAFALQSEGWYLRRDISWEKPNCQPESIIDRPAGSHEYIFLLSKSVRYFYDRIAVMQPASTLTHHRGRKGVGPKAVEPGAGIRANISYQAAIRDVVLVRNLRSVWRIPTVPTKHKHYAAFPPRVPELCILAGTSERGCCPQCEAPWKRILKKNHFGDWHPDRELKRQGINRQSTDAKTKYQQAHIRARGQRLADKTKWDEVSEYMLGGNLKRNTAIARDAGGDHNNPFLPPETIGWKPTCRCYDVRYRSDYPQARNIRKRKQREKSGDWWRRVRRQVGKDSWPTVPCVVLDSFVGSGVTAGVAKKLGRTAIGLDRSYAYLHDTAVKRVEEIVSSKPTPVAEEPEDPQLFLFQEVVNGEGRTV